MFLGQEFFGPDGFVQFDPIIHERGKSTRFRRRQNS
jgi:hypothetical protein